MSPEKPNFGPKKVEIQHEWAKKQLESLSQNIGAEMTKEKALQILTERQNKPFEGSSVPTVLASQVALKMLGYDPGKLDGLMGKKGQDSQTKRATRSFQKEWNKEHSDNPIAEDGQLGPVTIGKLIEALGGEVAEGEATPEEKDKHDPKLEKIRDEAYAELLNTVNEVEGFTLKEIKFKNTLEGAEDQVGYNIYINDKKIFTLAFDPSKETNSGKGYFINLNNKEKTYGLNMDTDTQSHWLSKEEAQAALKKAKEASVEKKEDTQATEKDPELELNENKAKILDYVRNQEDLEIDESSISKDITIVTFKGIPNLYYKVTNEKSELFFKESSKGEIYSMEGFKKSTERLIRAKKILDGSVLKEIAPDWTYLDKKNPIENSTIYGLQFNTTVPFDTDKDIPKKYWPYPNDADMSFNFLNRMYNIINDTNEDWS